MPKVIVNDVSVVSYKCEMIFNNVNLAFGTCFFYRFSGKSFIVSNWHNYSGRDPQTEEALNAYAAIPNKIKVLMPLSEKLGFSQWQTYNLTDSEENPIWLEHQLKNRIDVAVLEVAVPAQLAPRYVNELKVDPYMELCVAGDVYIVGYPLGLTVAETLPLWKRASFASEPGIDVDELPKYLVDTATREGMSGSPVFARGTYIKGTHEITGNPYEDNRPWSVGYTYNFIGIYSGRLGKDTFMAQLGVVWKRIVIEEIIQNGFLRKQT